MPTPVLGVYPRFCWHLLQAHSSSEFSMSVSEFAAVMRLTESMSVCFDVLPSSVTQGLALRHVRRQTSPARHTVLGFHTTPSTGPNQLPSIATFVGLFSDESLAYTDGGSYGVRHPGFSLAIVERNELRRDCMMIDSLGRSIHYLRLSITRACMMQCSYCRPAALVRDGRSVLTLAEIVALVRHLVVRHGVTKVRLTGGEPTSRPDLPQLVRRLSGNRRPGRSGDDHQWPFAGRAGRSAGRRWPAAGQRESRFPVSADLRGHHGRRRAGAGCSAAWTRPWRPA